jgi:hypothetical protein
MGPEIYHRCVVVRKAVGSIRFAPCCTEFVVLVTTHRPSATKNTTTANGFLIHRHKPAQLVPVFEVVCKSKRNCSSTKKSSTNAVDRNSSSFSGKHRANVFILGQSCTWSYTITYRIAYRSSSRCHRCSCRGLRRIGCRRHRRVWCRSHSRIGSWRHRRIGCWG